MEDLPPLPTTMKILGADGKAEVISLGIGAADEVSHCCGLPPPPGGWFGPFGFFRLVGFAFGAMMVLAALLALLATALQDGLGFLSSVLLALAAACCGITAYSHEGLANEVTEMARQNEQYAARNERLAQQVQELGGVAERLDSLQSSLNVHMDELQKTLDALHHAVAMEQLATLVRAFTDADSFGTTDQRLTGGEVEEFFSTSAPILHRAAPDFDFERLQQEASTGGIGVAKMRLLVNAVVAGSDPRPGRTAALLGLVLFSVDPQKHLNECCDVLHVVLQRNSREEVKAILHEKQEKHRGANGGLPCEELQDLANRVMLESNLVAVHGRALQGIPTSARNL